MTNSKKAIGKLSLAALAIDFLLLVILSQAVADRFAYVAERRFGVSSDWLFLVILPALLVLHAFVVEVLANGYSIGRLATGLKVTGRRGTLTSREKVGRFLGAITSFGSQLFSPSTVARHNAGESSWIVSDLVGDVESRPQRAAGKQPGRAARKTGVPEWTISVIQGNGKGITVSLTSGSLFASKGYFTIGRDRDWSDLYLSDATVSARHCVLRARGGAIDIKDWGTDGRGSTHKTFVDSQIAAPGNWHPVPDGAEIRLGAVTLRLKLG